MTVGYLNGWLTFKYPNQFSHLREALILREVKNSVLADVYHLRTLKTGMLAPHSDEAMKASTRAFEQYVHSTLPSLMTSSKIEPITPQTAAHWKKLDEELNKHRKKKKPKAK